MRRRVAVARGVIAASVAVGLISSSAGQVAQVRSGADFTQVPLGSRVAGTVPRSMPRAPDVMVNLGKSVTAEPVDVELSGRASSERLRDGRQLLLLRGPDGVVATVSGFLPVELQTWMQDSYDVTLRFMVTATPAGLQRDLTVTNQRRRLQFLQRHSVRPIELTVNGLGVRQEQAPKGGSTSPTKSNVDHLPIVVMGKNGVDTLLWPGQYVTIGDIRIYVLVSEFIEASRTPTIVQEGDPFSLQLLMVSL